MVSYFIYDSVLPEDATRDEWYAYLFGLSNDKQWTETVLATWPTIHFPLRYTVHEPFAPDYQGVGVSAVFCEEASVITDEQWQKLVQAVMQDGNDRDRQRLSEAADRLEVERARYRDAHGDWRKEYLGSFEGELDD